MPKCPDQENPNCMVYDAANDTLIKDVTHALSRKFTGALGGIDTAVFNPSRVMKIPGTYARKARHSAERPHIRSKMLHV